MLIALAALAGLLIGLYLRGLAPTVPRRLIITQETAKALIEFPGSGDADKAQLLVGGKPERDLRLFTYRIQIKGVVLFVRAISKGRSAEVFLPIESYYQSKRLQI